MSHPERALLVLSRKGFEGDVMLEGVPGGKNVRLPGSSCQRFQPSTADESLVPGYSAFANHC